MARRRAKAELAVPATHLERTTSWCGLGEGDPVDLLDAQGRGASWRFAAHVTNVQTTEVWVEVLGGRPGELRRRSVRPEQVYPYRTIKGGTPTAPALSDAPRLSL